MRNKNVIICVIVAICIIIFTLISTIVWYHFFEKHTEEKVITNQLYISNNSEQVANTLGIDKESSVNKQIESYIFTVENTSKKDISYKLLIEDVSASLVTDGCTKDTMLTRDDLVYELSLNGEVITKDNMDKISKNVIDAKTIKAGTTNQYELKFWIKEGVTDYLNKHYHYEINLSV